MERAAIMQGATNFLSKKAIGLIAAGRTFPPVGPIRVDPNFVTLEGGFAGMGMRGIPEAVR